MRHSWEKREKKDRAGNRMRNWVDFKRRVRKKGRRHRGKARKAGKAETEKRERKA
jgi:hypothetical protein